MECHQAFQSLKLSLSIDSNLAEFVPNCSYSLMSLLMHIQAFAIPFESDNTVVM